MLDHAIIQSRAESLDLSNLEGLYRLGIMFIGYYLKIITHGYFNAMRYSLLLGNITLELIIYLTLIVLQKMNALRRL
jgi:hypothetical protein